MAGKKGFTTHDALLQVEKVLPAAAGSTVSDALDLGPISSELGVRSEPFELEASVPALTGTLLPASHSIAYLIQASNDSTFASGITEYEISSLNQTGGANGAAAVSARFRPALDSPRYWRMKATLTGASPGTGINDLKYGLKHFC